jgi:hypothetical protein
MAKSKWKKPVLILLALFLGVLLLIVVLAFFGDSPFHYPGFL